MPPATPRIALISATTSAWAPAHAAFAAGFPEAEIWNLLDDRLLDDAGPEGLTSELADRMHRLIDHAITGGADAVLLTCSLYGPVAARAALDSEVPMQGPDDALFAAARAAGAARVGMVSSGAGPLEDSLSRLRTALGPGTEVVGILAVDAVEANRRGDQEGVVRAVQRAVDSAPAADLYVLGQYSLSPAEILQDTLGVPVLAGPSLAVTSLRSALGQEEG